MEPKPSGFAGFDGARTYQSGRNASMFPPLSCDENHLDGGVNRPAGLNAPVVSPHGGKVTGRQSLQERFASRLSIHPGLTRKVVSWQGNRQAPGLRWMKYKEGFSGELVDALIEDAKSVSVLDPFSGIGTAPLTAAGRGLEGAGIEIMPVGVLASHALACAANGLNKTVFEKAGQAMLEHLESDRAHDRAFAFPHVRITEHAFPMETEVDLAKAREYIAGVEDSDSAMMLNFACMSVLEDISYTRKDGQYLRWDHRSGRRLRTRLDKGPVQSLPQALRMRLREIYDDITPLKAKYGAGMPKFTTGSCLQVLRELPDGAFDTVITSPPYANRYDYTRTYALELAWLGYGQEDFAALRQSLLSATVENKPKKVWLANCYDDSAMLQGALRMYEEQDALHEVIQTLEDHAKELSNPHVIRLIKGYFLEMAVVIAELGRVVRPGGAVYMVNDNVQYHGEEVPVDLILSDFAEQSGFECRHIWALARGKGNSSQQMGRFGRREIRKCMYKWSRTNG